MPNCIHCGETIEFRYIDGRSIPLHLNGGSCNGGSISVNYSGYSRCEESSCSTTHCPECGEEVYFIRHNGGSVWIDPPLGWPWYKHGCMDTNRSTLASNIALNFRKLREGLEIGVVQETEVSRSRRCSLIKIEAAENQNLIFLMRNNAGFLVGRLVVYELNQLFVSCFENDTYMFRIVTQYPSTDQTNIKCPECEKIVKKSELSQHLRFSHGFPQRIQLFRMLGK